jgi:predicted flap endonuclease-1-like 5' DNA nuclease
MPNGWGSGTHVKLEEVEGIGPKYAQRLRKAGVRSLHGLLKKGAKPGDRKEIAKTASLSSQQVLEWVNRADLFRVNGVGSEYSDLLEKAGVDTAVELAKRKPVALLSTLAKVNESKKLVRRLPTEKQVNEWVKHAKELPRVIEY